MNELEKVIAQYQDKLNDVTNNYQQKIGRAVHDNFGSFSQRLQVFWRTKSLTKRWPRTMCKLIISLDICPSISISQPTLRLVVM